MTKDEIGKAIREHLEQTAREKGGTTTWPPLDLCGWTIQFTVMKRCGNYNVRALAWIPGAPAVSEHADGYRLRAVLFRTADRLAGFLAYQL